MALAQRISSFEGPQRKPILTAVLRQPKQTKQKVSNKAKQRPLGNPLAQPVMYTQMGFNVATSKRRKVRLKKPSIRMSKSDRRMYEIGYSAGRKKVEESRRIALINNTQE